MTSQIDAEPTADILARTMNAPTPWNPSAVAHLPRSERQRAYFAWHRSTKALCKTLGISMPVREKRPKAVSSAERKQRLSAQNALVRSKRIEKDKERNAAYYAANKDKLIERKRIARMQNPENFRARSREWAQNNREKLAQKVRTESFRINRQARHRVRVATDLQYKLRRHLRKTVHWAVAQYGQGRGRKSASIVSLLGCSMEHFISHLETLWQPGMSWKNYGLKGWHIDHKRPCASFDLSCPDQQRICFHYSNLQPLWATDNHKKGDKLDWCPLMSEAA